MRCVRSSASVRSFLLSLIRNCVYPVKEMLTRSLDSARKSKVRLLVARVSDVMLVTILTCTQPAKIKECRDRQQFSATLFDLLRWLAWKDPKACKGSRLPNLREEASQKSVLMLIAASAKLRQSLLKSDTVGMYFHMWHLA